MTHDDMVEEKATPPWPTVAWHTVHGCAAASSSRWDTLTPSAEDTVLTMASPWQPRHLAVSTTASVPEAGRPSARSTTIRVRWSALGTAANVPLSSWHATQLVY